MSLAVPAALAQPGSQAVTRGSTTASQPPEVPAIDAPEPAVGFAYLTGQTASTGARRLVTQHAQVELGRDGDHFVDLLELDDGSVVATGSRSDGDEQLVVVRVDASSHPTAQQSELAVPRSKAGNRQLGPRLTRARNTGQQEALTLAWLESTDARRSQVWAADTEGEGFGRAYLLADAGPGGQIALTGVTRADGAQFYIWSRFDGVDSEIFWVKRDFAEQPEWTRPRRLNPNNEVPDINPTITAFGDVVFAAWSSYDFSLDDGTYRVYLARFEGGQWTQPVPITGAGGIYPRFVAGTSLPTVSHLNAKHRRWDYQQLDGSGNISAAASTAKIADLRPIVLRETDRGVQLAPATAPTPKLTAAIQSQPLTRQATGQTPTLVSVDQASRARANARSSDAGVETGVFELRWEMPR